jgi:F0F1-type ATP synthase membrane subunit b/b'
MKYGLLLLPIMLILTETVFAAGGSGGGFTPDVWSFVKLQIMNFIAFAALIIFLSYSKIAPVFKQQRQEYLEKSQAAQAKLEAAKKERDELKEKISKLELGANEALKKAESQAEAAYKAKILEVKNSISSLNKDLEGQIEGLKRHQAKALKDLLMERSISELKKDLGSEVDEKLLVQLQNSFVENVVRV